MKGVLGVLILSLFLILFVPFVSGTTESISLGEGETITHNGHTFLINFISINEVRLIVDGTDTDLLSIGESQIVNDVTITIQGIIASSAGGYLVEFTVTASSLKSKCINNSCKLYEGETLIYNDHIYSLSFVSFTGIILNVNGAKTDLLSVGESQTIGDITITIISIVVGDFGGGYVVEFIVSTGLKSKCINNSCDLYEGETITHNGHTFSISFASIDEVILNVDGTDTDKLSMGKSQVINDIKVTINAILIGEDFKGGGLIIVLFTFVDLDLKSSCTNNSCKLYEGETIIYNDHIYSLSFISSSSVRLNVDGTNTDLLSIGASQTVNGVTITIQGIIIGDDFATGNSFYLVEFTVSEGYFCTDSDYGKNFYVKGETSGYKIRVGQEIVTREEVMTTEDGCYLSSGVEISGLTEYYCMDGVIESENIECNCVDGACLGEEIIPKDEPEEIPEDTSEGTYFCRGCELDNKCYPFGYRKSGEFCSDNLEFVAQSEAGEVCENNFECDSNVCISGECIGKTFIQNILDFFRRLFGGS